MKADGEGGLVLAEKPAVLEAHLRCRVLVTCVLVTCDDHLRRRVVQVVTVHRGILGVTCPGLGPVRGEPPLPHGRGALGDDYVRLAVARARQRHEPGQRAFGHAGVRDRATPHTSYDRRACTGTSG